MKKWLKALLAFTSATLCAAFSLAPQTLAASGHARHLAPGTSKPIWLMAETETGTIKTWEELRQLSGPILDRVVVGSLLHLYAHRLLSRTHACIFG